jgi:hypothetical protein
LLDLGRTRRIASHTQTLALIARDQGCSFPGCTHPPEYCDRHHITAWINGGATDVDNLTLLCRYHHTHFLGHGWTCTLNDDGIIEWRPPPWVDRERAPLTNHRIRRHVIHRAGPGDRQPIPSAAAIDSSTAHPKDSSTAPKDSSTAHPKDSSTAHPKDSRTAHPKDSRTAHPKDSRTVQPKDSSVDQWSRSPTELVTT